MYIAAVDGDVVTIRRLAAEGADVNVPGAGGTRPLHVAAKEGHVDAVRVLVEVGAEIEARASQGVMALHWAAAEGHVAVVKTMVDLGADKEDRLGWSIWTRLSHLSPQPAQEHPHSHETISRRVLHSGHTP